MPVCCAVNCSNKSKAGSGKTFHRFPHSKPDVTKQWVVNIRRDKWTPDKWSVVCSDHFEESCFDRTGQTVRLKEGAIPTNFNFPSHLVKAPKQRKAPLNRVNTETDVKERIYPRQDGVVYRMPLLYWRLKPNARPTIYQPDPKKRKAPTERFAPPKRRRTTMMNDITSTAINEQIHEETSVNFQEETQHNVETTQIQFSADNNNNNNNEQEDLIRYLQHSVESLKEEVDTLKKKLEHYETSGVFIPYGNLSPSQQELVNELATKGSTTNVVVVTVK